MVIAHRPLRGSRLSSFYPPLSPEGSALAELDSAFQLQEYISLLIRQNPHDVETIVSVPGKPKGKEAADEKAEQSVEKDGKSDVVVDEACWVYEQLRRLAQDLSHPLITTLQQECTRASCPEMKAGEWLYLCTAHGSDGALEQCCAIDYIIHTLDSATALLNSPRAFPSRISIPHASLKHFSSLARRLARIFTHAYFYHREAFESAEAESSLYARFLALTARFDLVPAEFLVIPPRLVEQESSSAGEANTALDERGIEPPRLNAAALEPLKDHFEQDHSQQTGGETSAAGAKERDRGDIPTDRDVNSVQRRWSPEKSGQSPGRDSPRKLGRNRTDTMVFTDAAAFTEELRAERDREHERGKDKGGGWDTNVIPLFAPTYKQATGSSEEHMFISSHSYPESITQDRTPVDPSVNNSFPPVHGLTVIANSPEACVPEVAYPNTVEQQSSGRVESGHLDPHTTTEVQVEAPSDDGKEKEFETEEPAPASSSETARPTVGSVLEDPGSTLSSGIILIGNSGLVCLPEGTSSADTLCSADIPTKLENGNATELKSDNPEESEPAQPEPEGDVSPAASHTEVHPEAAEPGEAEANTTLEEDLQNVEDAL